MIRYPVHKNLGDPVTCLEGLIPTGDLKTGPTVW